MPVSHPVDTELDDFLLGKLAGPDQARLEGHLSECSACLAAASSKASADTFIELLVAADTRLTFERSVASTPVPNATPSAFSPTVDLLSSASRVYDPLLPPPELCNHPRYRLIRLIGAGGMGTVWLAEHLVLGREVAVKVIRPEFLTKPGASERFRREARSVAHLAHPNIVAAYDAEEANGIHFLAMEYVPGENLGARLRSSGPLPVADACRAARDVARALAAAHSAGMIHRDVKPQNLIRMPDGVTKVLDFGLVTTAVGDLDLKMIDFGLVDATAGQPDLTGGDVLVGTPDYIAPEQAEDARAADARSDIYSLGCTLYHLLAGRVPFPHGNMLQKLDSHRGCEPAPIPDLPDGLTAVLAKMTAKRPAVRHQTADEVAVALNPFCLTRHPPSVSKRSRWRRSWIPGFLLISMGGLTASAVYLIKTDTGELAIETTDPDVEVLVKQTGKLVTVIDPKSNNKVTLRSGEYEFELNGKPTGLKLDIERATLKRGKTVVAKITRAPPIIAAAALGPAAYEEMYHLPSNHVIDAEFSADGKRFLTIEQRPGKFVVSVRDTTTGKSAANDLPFPDPVIGFFRVRFIPGSTELLIQTGYNVVRWDTATEKKIGDVCLLPIFGGKGTDIRGVTSDGASFAAFAYGPDNSYGNHVVVFNLATGAERFRVKPLNDNTILCMAPVFSPDGKTLATVDTTPSLSVIRLWETAGQKLLQSINVKGAVGGMIQFGSDGQMIAAAYATDEKPSREVVGVWATDTGRPVSQFELPRADKVEGHYLLPHSLVSVVYHDGWSRIAFWDTVTARKAGEYKGHGNPYDSAWRTTRDGKYAVFHTTKGVTVLRRTEAPTPKP